MLINPKATTTLEHTHIRQPDLILDSFAGN